MRGPLPGGAGRRLIPRSLRHRDYTLLWSGQTVSVLGDGVFTIAIALETLRISDHPASLAYVETARVAPNALLLLFAGAIVDRLPRRLVILGADLLRGGAIAAIAVLAAVHALDVTGLVVLSAAVGVGDAFFYPAYRAVMPELLPPELLTQGNAFNSASQTVGQAFAGPAIGGVLVALAGTPVAFAVDAASFAASALCLVGMRRVPAPAPSGRSVAADVGQGIRWTMRQRWLWFGIQALGVANFAAFSPMAVTIPLLVRNVLHQGPAAYGVTFAAVGVGGLAAAAVAARLGSPRRRMSMIWVAWAVASFALAGLGLVPDVFAAAACGAVTYFGVVYGNLLWPPSCRRWCRPACSAAPPRSTGSSRPACRPWASCSPGTRRADRRAPDHLAGCGTGRGGLPRRLRARRPRPRPARLPPPAPAPRPRRKERRHADLITEYSARGDPSTPWRKWADRWGTLRVAAATRWRDRPGSGLAGRVRIERFDPATEPAKVKAGYRLLSACRPVDDPDGPPMSEAFFSATLQHGWGEPQQMALATGEGGEACGGYVLELPQRKNRQMGFVNFLVAPAHRRRGVGTELLRHAAQVGRGHGRTLLYTFIKIGSAAEAFADGMGGRPGLVHIRRVLDIDSIPAGHLAGLLARAEQAAAGYSLLSWEGPTPEDRVGQVAAVRNALADAPHQPGKEVRVVDAEWVRQADRRSVREGLRRYSVAVRCDQTGELAGLTQVSVDPHMSCWARQLITAVSRAHRGHRLGLLIKVAMLDLLARAEPGLRRMSTGNAQDNTHMVTINEEIGFRILDHWRFWEISPAAVLA